MKYKFFATFTLVLGLFLWIRIFPDQIRIFGRSGFRKKRLIRIREKKPGSETLTPRCVSICCICTVIVSTESDSVMCYQSGVAEKFFFVK